MFSRLKAYMLLSFSFLAVGCGDFLSGDGKKESEKIQIQAQDLTCLEKVPQNLKKYFNDELPKESIQPIFSCLQKGLSDFAKFTRGEDRNSYKAEEVQHYFNRYFLEKNKISKSYLKELMKLKVLFVGGQATHVTRAELDKTQQFLDLVSELAVDLSGHMRLMRFEAPKDSVDRKDLSNLSQKLVSVLNRLIDFSQFEVVQYKFVDFKAFLSETKNFVGENPSLASFEKWLPLMESVQQAFLGSYSHWSAKKEWKEVSAWVAELFVSSLHISHFISGQSFGKVATWDDLIETLFRSLNLIENSPVMKRDRVIRTEAIDQILDESIKVGLFETATDPQIWKNSYRKALFHLVEGKGRLAGSVDQIRGLEVHHIGILQFELKVWSLVQKSTNLIFQGREEQLISHLDIVEHTQRQTLNDLFPETVVISSLERPLLQQAWATYQELMTRNPQMMWREDGLVEIAQSAQLRGMSFAGQNWSNAIRMWVRFTLKGYGDHSSDVLEKTSMPALRMVHLEEDFREFGRAMGFLDARQSSPAERTFLEGNLFSYVGNGDQFLNFHELYDLLSLMMSGGRRMVDGIYEDLWKGRCLIAQKDPFGKEYVREGCFLARAKAQYADYFRNMPGLVKYLHSLTDSGRAEFLANVLAVSKITQSPRGFTEYTEIRAVTSILGYLESLMVVFDRDRDGLLSEPEILRALNTRFRDFVAAQTPGHEMVQDLILEDGFLYLVHEGRKPEISELISFKIRRARGLPPIGRDKMLRVMKSLKG